MSRERNAVVGSGEAGGLALRGGSDARNENGLRVTRHVCGVLSIGLGCELARFRRYTSGFRGVTRTRKISLGLELLLSTTTHWRRSPHLTIHIFFSALLYHPQNAHTNIVTVSVIASL